MKARILAGVLAVVSLAACGHDSTFTVSPDLVGAWRTESWTATFPIAPGATPGTMSETWTLAPSGQYMRHTDFQTASGETYTTYVESGRWGVKGEKLVLTTVMQAENEPPLSSQPPVPHAITPRTSRSEYHVLGNELTLQPPCPPDAICDGFPLVLHRIVFID